MAGKIRTHPLSAKGKYFIEFDYCMCSESCTVEAPNNIRTAGSTSYVFKQPETPEEEAACKRAIFVCPLEAVRDDGDEVETEPAT